MDISSLERELEEIGGDKRGVGDRLSRLQQEQAVITQQSSARGALDSMQKQKGTKEQQYQKL